MSGLRLTGIFVGFLYGALVLWSAVSIYRFGEYDSKFGGRAANFLLGLQWGVPMTLAVGLGYLLPAAIATRRVGAPTRGATALAAVGAVGATALMSTGVVGEFSNVLPLGTVGGLILAFAVCGGVVGSVTMVVARWLLKGRRRLSPPQKLS